MNREHPENENIQSTIIQYWRPSKPIMGAVEEEVVPELPEAQEADPDGQAHKLPGKP